MSSPSEWGLTYTETTYTALGRKHTTRRLWRSSPNVGPRGYDHKCKLLSFHFISSSFGDSTSGHVTTRGAGANGVNQDHVLFVGGVKSGATGRHPAATVSGPRTSTAVCIRSIRFLLNLLPVLYHNNSTGHVRSLLVILLLPETVRPRALPSGRVQLYGRSQIFILIPSSRYRRFLPPQQAERRLLSRALPRKLHLALMPRAQHIHLPQQRISLLRLWSQARIRMC